MARTMFGVRIFSHKIVHFDTSVRRGWQTTPVQRSPVSPTCIELYFYYGVSESGKEWLCRYLTRVKFVARVTITWVKDKIRRLTVGRRCRHGTLRTVLRESLNWSPHARTSRTPCVKQLFRARKTSTKRPVSNTPLKNSYFRYKCEKVILSSRGRLRPSQARVKRPHDDKITFSLAYLTQLFYTMYTKLYLAHAVLFERAPSGHFTHGVWK